jgi:hypothetical protein
MQATGMVNDHLTSCFRYRQCVQLGKKRLAVGSEKAATPAPN